MAEEEVVLHVKIQEGGWGEVVPHLKTQEGGGRLSHM